MRGLIGEYCDPYIQDLEAIKRMPETHQICKAVKRKMVYEFRRAQKMKKAMVSQV